MAAAGYTGTVHQEWTAGYSSAAGYSGVVHGATDSGFTGAAPVARSSGTRRVVLPPPSSYDAALATADTAPGSVGPTDYGRNAPVSPPPEPDPPGDGGADTEPEAGREPPEGSPDDSAPSDGGDAAAVQTLAAALSRIVGDQARLSLEPGPPRGPLGARARAEAALRTPLMLAPLPSELLGPLADELRDTVRRVTLTGRPDTLGGAFMQGAADEALGMLLDSQLQALDAAVTGPSPTVVRSVRSLVDGYAARRQAGEGVAEAFNSLLNPAVEAFNEVGMADTAAERAISLAQAGDARAIDESREAGRHTLRSMAGVARTVQMATGTARAGSSAITRVRASGTRPGVPAVPRFPRDATVPTSPPPHASQLAPASPLTPTRGDGVTGFVYQAPVPSVPAPTGATPHPRFPDVKRFTGAWLDAAERQHAALLLAMQRHNADEWSKLPAATRRRMSFLQATEPLWAEREWLTAARLQRGSPQDGFLVQVRWLAVEADGRSTPAWRILRSIDKRSPGRVEDIVQFRTDGKILPHELKLASQLPPGSSSSGALLGAYPAGAQVEVARFNPGSALGKQLRKTQRMLDYARGRGGLVRGVGYTLDGQLVEIVVDPANVLPTRVARYGELSH